MVWYHSSLVEQRKKILVLLVRPDSYQGQLVPLDIYIKYLANVVN